MRSRCIVHLSDTDRHVLSVLVRVHCHCHVPFLLQGERQIYNLQGSFLVHLFYEATAEETLRVCLPQIITKDDVYGKHI